MKILLERHQMDRAATTFLSVMAIAMIVLAAVLVLHFGRFA